MLLDFARLGDSEVCLDAAQVVRTPVVRQSRRSAPLMPALSPNDGSPRPADLPDRRLGGAPAERSDTHAVPGKQVARVVERSAHRPVGIRARFPVGDSVTAYINPASPSQGFLIHQLLLFPLAFVGLPLLLGVFLSYAFKNAQQGLSLAAAERVPILDATNIGPPVGQPEDPRSLPANDLGSQRL